MKRGRLKAEFDALIALSAAERARRVARLSDAEVETLPTIGRCGRGRNSALPQGDWSFWLILAGRGAGKTRTGAETVRAWARDFALVNLIGATQRDARDIMVLGESGVLAVCPRRERPHFARASERLEWPNGAISQIFSAEEPDRLRGKQHMKLWLDELAAWRLPDAFDQAMLGLRLGAKPQAVITTTPRPTRLIKQLIADPHAVVSRGSTFDNARFLARSFISNIASRFEGRALGRQELYAEIVEEAPGALWTRALIERQRLPGNRPLDDYAEIVVGVDPPARSGAKSDECGIVVVGAHLGRGHPCARRSHKPGRDAGRMVGAGGGGVPPLLSQSRRRGDQQRRRDGGAGAAAERSEPAGAQRNRDARKIPARGADRCGLRARRGVSCRRVRQA